MQEFSADGRLLYSSPGMNFFEFWFTPFRAYAWQDTERVMAAFWLAVPVMCFLVWSLARSRKLRQPNLSEFGAAMIFPCWVSSAIALRSVPHAFLEDPRYHSPHLQWSLIVPGIVIFFPAFVLTFAKHAAEARSFD